MSVDIKSVGFIQAKHSSNFIVVLDCKVLNNEDLMKYGVDGMDTFYVEDYRFNHIWKNPIAVMNGGCTEFVEPNLSLFDTTPVAYGLQQIYMKRWISRFWQECGAKVYADLNVAKKFYKYNRLGIPEGYNAFATRGYADRLEYLKQEIQTAREISGHDKPNMIVYGGGEGVREVCLQHNVLYVEQFMANRGRIINNQGDG